MTIGACRHYREFPLHALPSAVRRYVGGISSAMNCDPTYSALPVLAALGAAIGSTHVATPKRGWQEPPFIFAVTIGLSGATKSPPFRDLELLAEDINDRLEAEFDAQLADYQVEFQQWQDAKTDGEDVGSPPEKPVERVFSRGDTTVPALLQELQNNPRGILIANDELAGWINGFTRNGSRDLPAWLQLSNAGCLNVIRKTGEVRKVRIRGVGVSVCGTIQPGVMARAMTEELRAAGLFARLLVAYPPRRNRIWSEAEVDESVRADFAALLNQLFDLEAGYEVGTGPTPRLVGLAPEAKAAFVRFYNANGVAMATGGDEECASRSKIEGYALRFALIFHCCRHKSAARNHPIDVEDMGNAISLAEWFIHESGRVYSLLRESPADQELHRLHGLVLRLAMRAGRDGWMTARDLQRHDARKYRSSQEARTALASLVAARLGEWENASLKNFRPFQTEKTTSSTSTTTTDPSSESEPTSEMSELSECLSGDINLDAAWRAADHRVRLAFLDLPSVRAALSRLGKH